MKKDLKQAKKNAEFIAKVKLDKGCSKCGYKEHAAALEFHHIQDKKHNISRIARSGVPQNVLDEEIKKCIILCANCHRIEHSKP
jgi:hypothetical protein